MSLAKVTRSDRHTRQDPCRVCGGGHDDKPHRGVRCHGYDGSDPRYCYCSREEYAVGEPKRTDAGLVWRHWLGEGMCHCGRTHTLAPVSGPGERPTLILVRKGPPAPISETAQVRPLAPYGAPVRVFEARRADGALMALHARFEWAEEGKDKPEKTYRWWRTGWSLDDLAVEDIPLYGMPALAAAAADAPVWLTEGEPPQEALQAAFKAAGYSAIVLATYGASAIPSDAQLRALVGHLVTLWPDPDPAGDTWRDTLTAKLQALGISVRVCVWPDAPPKGDAVEYFATGGTVAELAALTSPACQQGTVDNIHSSIETPAIGWEARARKAEAKIAETAELVMNRHLDAGAKVVRLHVEYEMDRRRIDGARTMPIVVNDYVNRDGVHRDGLATCVNMCPGTAFKHLHGPAMEGLELVPLPSKEGEKRRHPLLAVKRAAVQPPLRELGANVQQEETRGGARENAGRKPTCPNCQSPNVEERRIIQTVKRTMREFFCTDCHKVHREQVGPDHVIATQNIVTTQSTSGAAEEEEAPTRIQKLISSGEEKTPYRGIQKLNSGGASLFDLADANTPEQRGQDSA